MSNKDDRPEPLAAGDVPPHRDLRSEGVARGHLERSARLKLKCAEELSEAIDAAAIDILSALRRGKKVLVCGNGGSAADAQHLASELTGRFIRHRRGLPAIALTTDTSALTAISNDYGYAMVFARQVEALAVAGDVLVAISTSGESDSVIRAAETAKATGCHVIGLSGRSGGRLAKVCERSIVVPADETALIQEVHGSIIHAWGTVIESWYLNE